MSARNVGRRRDTPNLADLGLGYLTGEYGVTRDCLPEEKIMGLAGRAGAASPTPTATT